MTSPQTTIQLAIELGKRAVSFDQQGNSEGAAYYYIEAAKVLNVLTVTNSDLPPVYTAKAAEYKQRAQVLLNLNRQSHSSATNDQQSVANRARFLISEALEADERGNKKEALHLYIEAVEHCQHAIDKTSDTALQDNLRKVAKQSLDRAEKIKESISEAQLNNAAKSVNSVKGPEASPSVESVTAGASSLKVSGSHSYTEEEKKVLRITSTINGREYVPFMSGDLQERFAYSLPFSDRHGKLQLSPKQMKSLARWARPDEISAEPKIIENIDCFKIKQTVVSDCSFVASLAVAAQYEKRYKKRLITNIIYPQNRAGDPVYNPCGKYMIKLRVNGVARKIVIDDYLPVGKHGELLCSYSVNRSELWVSLLEKAYMKVMGGYDFPGSNSNIDLHALTGWIPERATLRSGETDFNKEALFKKLYDRFHKGDVLVTVATGEMSDAEADRSGLVSAHAYALLNIVEIKGVRLIMLKNPWSHVRWRGNYSELDALHWTEELKKALNYDPESAASFDNGVFWIDYDSLCKFFEVVYLSWNPSLFSHTYCTHDFWRAGQGPIKDMYNIGENPQYSLQVRSPGASAVWVLLTRHITEIEDFRENREYITMLVYKNEGKRVYYPSDPPPYIDGVRINSPHYLCKILQSTPGTHNYTLVVSQYEKLNTIYYTLRIFSTCPFELRKISKSYRYKDEIKNGCWKGPSAGGCGNHPKTYPNNPRFQLTVEGPATTQLLIELKGPKQYQLGFDVICTSTTESSGIAGFSKKSSGAYRSGFVILDIENVPAGVYQIVPSTYLPGQEGPFFLTVQSTTLAIKLLRG